MHADAALFCTPAELLCAGSLDFGWRGIWKISNVDVVIAVPMPVVVLPASHRNALSIL